MWAVAKKDFKTFFYSPIGYIVIAVFLFIMGIIMYLLTINGKSIDFNFVYEYLAKYGLPIVISVLSMRSFSEEKNKDTDTLLLSASKKITQIILGKILAITMVVLISVVISLVYCLLFLQYGNIDFKLLFVTLLGFLLLSISYASFGVLVSSLTESQIISAIITIIYLFLPTFLSYGNGIISYLSLPDFFSIFSMGMISLKSIVVFITFSISCILLTTVKIKRKN